MCRASRTIPHELHKIMTLMKTDSRGSIQARPVSRMSSPPTITAAVEIVSPIMCTKTLRIFTSRENFQSSPAMSPFIRTPAAATSIMSVGSTRTGCIKRCTAARSSHTDTAMSESAFTKPASTPAR